jgi:hypothetical protein
VDPDLETLLAELVAARDAGRVVPDEAARAIGAMTLDAYEDRVSDGARGWWHHALANAGVEEHVVDSAYAALRSSGRAIGDPDRQSPIPDEIDAVVEHVRRTLGGPSGWPTPTTYASSALAVIDSIWSIGVRYTGVRNVIERYRQLRVAQGANPDDDTPADLVAAIEQLGGPEAFADALRNRQRTSSKSGILKAEAVLLTARVLVDAGVQRPSDVLDAHHEQLDRLRAAWVLVHGQGSGISLDYFLMLSGIEGVKGDRMIRRFVAQALGLTNELAVDAERAVKLVRGAAGRIGVDDRQLDFAIWNHESERAGQ